MLCPYCLLRVAEDRVACRCGYRFVDYQAPITVEPEDRRADFERENGLCLGFFLVVCGTMLSAVSCALAEEVGVGIIFTGLIVGGFFQVFRTLAR